MKAFPLAAVKEKLFALLTDHFGKEKSARIADVILYAELNGIEGQGIAKLSGTEPLQSIEAEGDLIVERKSDVSALIHGNRQPSFYTAQIATDTAIDIARERGIAVVGANGIYSSAGSIGYYAERLAQADLIGIVMAECPPSIAPFGVLPPLFGTNPIAAAFPTLKDPLVFDMSTAAITWYGLVLAKMRGQQIPQGLAMGENGNLTTDPREAMNGAILPFGNSAKASSLAMMVEIMAGPLVGVRACKTDFEGDWGLFILAISPSLLGDTEHFKASCSTMIDVVRQAPTIDGKAVRLPGDRAKSFRADVHKSGMLELDPQIAAVLGL